MESSKLDIFLKGVKPKLFRVFGKHSVNNSSYESHFQTDIRLYSEDEKFQVNVPVDENYPQPTAEKICQDISKKIGIIPLLSHLFGLRLVFRDGGDSVWIQPQQVLSLFPFHGGNELHYRIRYVPNKDNIHKLSKLCIEAFEYLYYQLKYDMVHEQFSTGVEGKEDFEKFFRGLAVIDMLISLRLKTADGNDSEENVSHVLKKVEQYLPPSLCRKNVFDRIFKPLETEMIRKLEEVRREFTPEKFNVHSLMMNNVRFLLASVPSVYITMFETFKFSIIRHATEKEGVTKIKFQRKTKMLLTLDLQSDENQLPSLQLGEVNPYTGQEDTHLRYPLSNLLGLSFIKVESDTETWWKVNINLRMGQDQVVYFSTETVCLSFLTMVEGYCRLCCDHYHSLCEDVAPTIFKEMMAIKAHGPISKKYAGQKLWNPRFVNEDFYLLRQNPKICDQYELLMRGTQPQTVNSLPLGVIKRNNGIYKLAEGYKWYRNIKELIVCKIRDMKEVNYLIPSEMKLPFSGECCDDLYELLLGKVMIFDPQNGSERSDKKAVPGVINASAVEYLDKLGEGEFTEVSKAKMKKHGPVAVKQISLRNTEECERYKFQECLLRGFQTSLLLNGEPRFFITFYGLSLTSPTMMVMKYAELGNFADLLRSRQSNDPISVEDRLEACTQVARGLLYMEENKIIHGNLCCKNLMAFQQKDGEVIVKIADPGLVHLYNQLPLDHNINMKRLPWIAVELFDDLTKLTMETELYAYGVLVWEIMSNAAHPFDKPPLQNMSHDERKKYYISKGKLGIPTLLEINVIQQDGPDMQQTQTGVNRGKNIMRQIIERCWDKARMRPRPKELLKDLYHIMQAYGVYSDDTAGSSGESSHYYYAHDDDDNSSGKKDSNTVFKIHPQVMDYSTVSTSPIKNPVHKPDGQPDGEENISPQPANQPLPENQSGNSEDSENYAQRIESFPSHFSIQVQMSKPSQLTSPVLSTQTESSLSPHQPMFPIASQAGFTSMNGNHLKQSDHQTGQQQVPSTGTKMTTKMKMTLMSSELLTVNEKDHLGEGNFGSVYSGEKTVGHEKIKVAIKIMKEISKNVQSLLVREAEVMSRLTHKNIVQTHGHCFKDMVLGNVKNKYPCLVMEYIDGGSLKKFLQTNENKIPADHLRRFCIEICQGMEYLYLEKIIHCDLATKNVLLTEDSMNGTIKIADFGLARVLAADKDYYRRKTETEMPFWSAPEYHCTQTFSFKADVWSCGTTFWEVYSFGRDPEFPGIKDIYVHLDALMKGRRLSQPRGCPDWIYQIMLNSWEYNPDQRPNIIALHSRLKEGPTPTQNVSHSPIANSASGFQSTLTPPSEISGAASSANHNEKKTSLPEKYIFRLSGLIIPDDRIQIQDIIGEGNFGQVKRGILDGQPVAIKCLKTHLSGGDDAKRFGREIELLHKAIHPNIVRLLGILRGQNDLFVMEYMENGNLRDYLIDQKKKGSMPSQTQLLRILNDIAAGMEYLTSINILHGDLTASNILLTGDLQAKVSDFGLGKVFNEVPYQRSEKAKFHYKWCAPEVLKYRTFNKTSDVWSYGILMWEVFTYGNEPNYGDSFSATSRNPQQRFTDNVLKDMKLPKPADCPEKIYREIMIKCWSMKSDDRPLFSDIIEKLLLILKTLDE
ncbi:hypothetical protein CHS0354_026124 [Potamilus streckersoni]|uniref:Non-specific protein-tyrosine kinase n=1 Tax=Potamilus streckersoni TaxID=2493646 RepID=A0AAE0S219_9BIVA|nr:hypothetical protein CHS0354_026124 [Potamilus streckersoni]